MEETLKHMKAVRDGWNPRHSSKDWQGSIAQLRASKKVALEADMSIAPFSYSNVKDLKKRINHRQSVIKKGPFLETYGESFENVFYDAIQEK
mmetsp:Transcript_32941/g.43404  ORF Transcript_32941/g.43404 Transcript_32941/m.43404 type:complete len:92 (-) Transcript_32941:1086-1361(-)